MIYISKYSTLEQVFANLYSDQAIHLQGCEHQAILRFWIQQTSHQWIAWWWATVERSYILHCLWDNNWRDIYCSLVHSV